ncbi:MAG: YdcF family protein [Deltaproteobacteria bacterium]|nr:YdcF family protein [Deltaproteobacteria bacterium]
MKRKGLIKLLLLLLIASVALCIWMPEKTLRYVGKALVVNDTPRYCDAIVILLGAETPERVVKAWNLYNQQIAKRIVFGTGLYPRAIREDMPANLIWQAAGHRYFAALVSLGIAEESIILVNTENAFDTASELSAICHEAKALHWKDVTLVTSPFHTLRTWLIWQRVCPGVMSYISYPHEPNLDYWWQQGRLIRSVGYEYGALMKELVRQIKN